MDKYNRKKSRNEDFLRFIGPYVSENNFHNIKSCGNFLHFYADETLEHKRLKLGFFCHNRFCPLCNYQKSKRKALLISTCMRYLKEEQDLEFIFLTLTTPNVQGVRLKSEIEKINGSFHKMMKRKKTSKAIKGFVRNLEITYNAKRDDFHPHLHVLLCVNKSYFTDSRIYISQNEWLSMWRQSMKDESITQVDVRKVDLSSYSAIAEISKYTSKDSDYLVNKQVFHYFYTSLKGKRGVGYGGVFKDAKKLYDSGDLDYFMDEDLIDYVYLLKYVWGPKEYVLNSAPIPLSEEEKKKINERFDELDLEDL